MKGLPQQEYQNPGAVQFGNFINYYQFNSAEQRLGLLSKKHWNIKIYAVDLDPDLIKRAQADNNCDIDIEFACLDVMAVKDFTKIQDYLDKYKRKKFDAVCCFSITMWIHLNHDDTGLQEFLRNLCSLSELLVVEAQPWRCYQTAERRMKKVNNSFPLFLKLKWRSNVVEEIEKYLTNTLQRTKVYESLPTKWKRKICFFK
ncbi:probable RNA methyltransferase CG11342 [Glossina fuscipes]|uniref:RNA methyltransferase n=1 Tax=Glossina fuscipes TaxID=7396 RepID=A0A9C5YXJ1_9MUSC|nr:probable RNA methyltransferase CG11342 [Glossina fuscipes]